MKTQVSHSPGPWERSPVSSVVGSLVSYGDISKGMSVCSVIPQLSKEVTEANADLIAAAPDMLAALEYFVNEAISSHPAEFVGLDLAEKFAQLAEAAIRKAKGE